GEGAELVRDGGDVVVRGTVRPVESAVQASHLLVTDGRTQVLVPTAASGVRIEPMHSVDLTRRFAAVTFDDVRLPGDSVVAEDDGARLRQLALVIANAESVGAMQASFDMTVAWAS